MPSLWVISPCLAAFLTAAVMLPSLVQAQEAEGGVSEAVDTEHIFGFTEGSDIGDKGEREIEHNSYTFLGKQGSYVAIENETDLRYGIDTGFRASINLLTDYHGISNAPGLPDRAAFGFSGLSTELDWALLERGKAPFGLTLSFIPQWRRLDDTSGAPQESFGFPIELLADVALSPNKWFAAVNLHYAPVFIRNPRTWTANPPVEISAATSFGIVSDVVFIGGEIRHLTQNQHGFFSRHALFAGPSIYVKLWENASVKLAWSAQIPDETTGKMDLVNYERHQLRLQLATDF